MLLAQISGVRDVGKKAGADSISTWIKVVIFNMPASSFSHSHPLSPGMYEHPIIFSICTSLFSEEPMSYVVELAAAEVEENPKATPAMREYASIRKGDAEERAHKVLEKHGLTVPMQIDKVDLADAKRYKGFPYIKFSSWVKYLLDSDRLPRLLCACDSLESMQIALQEFWDRYEAIFPTHQIFAMRDAGAVDLRFVVPVFSHTDEGRSYKKQPLWLLSTHGALGRGTKAYLKKGKDRLPLRRNGFGLNFCGHTWSTNFMFSCMLRKLYKKKPEVLDHLVSVYAKDMEDLLVNGVVSGNGSVRVRCCHLGTKGDLPALARMGNMKHTFGNVPKAAQSKKPCEGICWMCKAGQEANPTLGLPHIPYEDTSGKPLWEGTLGDCDAWDEVPPILQGVPLREEDHWQFFKTDVWHNLHLGLAKHWVASALVSMIENLDFPGGSMDEKIDFLNTEYKNFCARKRISPHCEELGRETLNWPQSSTCPVGAWNKGSASTHFFLFLDDLCQRWSTEMADDPLLQAIVLGIDFID
jgi:hypothetical protein